MNALRRGYVWMQRNPVSLALALSFGAVALALVTFGQNVQQGARITRIERSPCAENPAGAECARVQAEVAQAEPLRAPCNLLPPRDRGAWAALPLREP